MGDLPVGSGEIEREREMQSGLCRDDCVEEGKRLK